MARVLKLKPSQRQAEEASAGQRQERAADLGDVGVTQDHGARRTGIEGSRRPRQGRRRAATAPLTSPRRSGPAATLTPRIGGRRGRPVWSGATPTVAACAPNDRSTG